MWASLSVIRCPYWRSLGEEAPQAMWCEQRPGCEGKCQDVLHLRGPSQGWHSSHKAQRSFWELSALPVPLDGHLAGHASAITHCPPGRAEPHHFAGGAGCCPWQRRMTYLLACQNLPCLWKSHPAKQNSPLLIGSSRGPC